MKAPHIGMSRQSKKVFSLISLGHVSRWIAATVVMASSTTFGATPDYIRQYLENFDKNPKKVMNTPLVKRDADGQPASPLLRFSAQDVATGKDLKARNEIRQKICESAIGGNSCRVQMKALSPYQSQDLAENMVDTGVVIRDLKKMENQNLRTGRLDNLPWSDTYWPTYQGGVAVRYADREFPASTDWDKNFAYVASRPARDIFASTDQSLIDRLAPAEKYDLLIGDSNATLTTLNWQAGEKEFTEHGAVPTWAGICHGWAPASFMLPEPQKTVNVIAADGKTHINFFRSDIKALTSLLWSKAAPRVRYIGTRCFTKDPEMDSNGRVTDPRCLDTNPGTWHMAVVNQIGVQKRSFVLDATFDLEVWNQPAVSYTYTYFNPKTNQPTNDLDDAKIKLKDFKKDKFKDYRASDTHSLVGVAMDLTFVVESTPTHAEWDGKATHRFVRTVTYMYDLELNDDNEIIGGEWYTNYHPDFMWVPPRDARAVTSADRLISDPNEWNFGQALPENWRAAALQSSNYGVPLANVVERLITESRRQ